MSVGEIRHELQVIRLWLGSGRVRGNVTTVDVLEVLMVTTWCYGKITWFYCEEDISFFFDMHGRQGKNYKKLILNHT